MKSIVMGCGRMGKELSCLLADAGHEVTVIDENAEALDQLKLIFNGRTVRGVGFDRNVLIQAGIEEADAFAATSPSDNTNIISARVARNIFHVPRVVTRLYDPRRAEIYHRLGLVTISMIHWGAERIFELLTHSNLDPLLTFGKGEVILTSIEIPAHIEGRTARDLSAAGQISIVAITRKNGEAEIPIPGTEFCSGDLVHIAVHSSAVSRLEALLGL